MGLVDTLKRYIKIALTHVFIQPTHFSGTYYVPRYNRELNSTVLALVELAVQQVRLASDSHLNKCRIITGVRGKDGGSHSRIRHLSGACERER